MAGKLRPSIPEGEKLATTTELAELLRTTPQLVRARCRDGVWPHLAMPFRGDRHRYLFTAEMVEVIVASMDATPVVTLQRRRRERAAAVPVKGTTTTRRRRSS